MLDHSPCPLGPSSPLTSTLLLPMPSLCVAGLLHAPPLSLLCADKKALTPSPPNAWQFHSVITRGSQYRVESMLLRLCRSQGYAAASPSKQQVKEQPALTSLPLIMEPEGRFYTSPVIVLDFRSLYPSVIIAYNYCYSTCLGPLGSLRKML